MALNFTMHHVLKNGTLYIDLKGDFDGSSAMELLDRIESCRDGAEKIYINTDGLRDVDPFGRAVFEKQISQRNGKCAGIVFTGSQKSKHLW